MNDLYPSISISVLNEIETLYFSNELDFRADEIIECKFI